jgi:MoaA/NifB/PqqE/SkfB family radical SAM enzyme
MINQRLFDHYGIDTTKDLKIRVRCPRPFDTVLIDKQGSCYACECQSWLPQSLGNLQVKTLGEIIGNDMHRHLQSSITDGTYRYCNEHQCSYIRSKVMMDGNEAQIKHLRLAIDDSCNLTCPSCRTGMVFHTGGPAFERGIRLADRVNDWLATYQSPVRVHLGSDGDPFASHVYRHFMEHTPKRDNITYSIMTNGLMFKDFHHRIPRVMNNLRKLAVSIDGALPETYEKLRRGARWHKLIEGLDSMAQVKSKRDLLHLEWHMVVQKDNWREMPQLLSLARLYNVDVVFFNMIRDWQTGLDFSEQKFNNDEQFKQLVDQLRQDPFARIHGLF